MTRLLTDTNALLGQSLGTCTIQRLIGRGGMGMVYVAQQTRPRREVAVKVLIPALLTDQPARIDFLARFRREADAIAALDHINIIPIYEYGEQEQIAYLVMPYVTGGSLHQVLERQGRLPLHAVLPILEQAAAALDYAHAKGIIHRDLKPGNILFHSDGRVLLADFGLAKVLREDADQRGTATLTNAGTVIGTPEYLSPEQAAGQTLDRRTDIYSLGIVLFQMLTGQVPFSGATPVATAIQHTLSQPPSLSQLNPAISPAIEAVVLKALAKKPDERYESAGQLAQALSAAADSASRQSREAVRAESSNIFPPVLLMGKGIVPLTPSAHEAETVVDMIKVSDRLANGQQFSSFPVRHIPPPTQRTGRQPWQAAVFGIMLILLLVVSGSLAYLYTALKGSPSVSVSHTVSPTPTSTTPSPTANVELPAPEVSVGQLLYGTPLPGNPCDVTQGAWSSTPNVHVACGTSATELSNMNLRHLTGIFLGALPNGDGIPNDYILQLQVRQGPHSHGAFGVLFRNQPDAANLGAYAFLLSPNNYWSANAYDNKVGTATQFYQHRTTVPLHGLVTIDISVQGDTFLLYINGREQGNEISSHYPSGTIGLAVDKGADVFFSNFALYAPPNK